MIKGDEWKLLTPEKIEYINEQLRSKSIVSVVSTIETQPSVAYSDGEP
jgi:hypothetical protein